MPATIRIHDGYARPVHETLVDGVRTFWVDDEEPFEAKLIFRVGRADESLLTSGVSHLIEHLALPQHDRHLSYVNGTTDPLLTFFEGAGERREVLDFLREVSAHLGKLPLDRLTREMRILREEAGDFSRTISSRLAWQRFGARHLGLYDEPEYGMYRLTSGQVTRWARRSFTSGNAVLWMTGRPPRNFGLGLPEGPPRPPPHPPAPTWRLPAWSTGSTDIIGWSTIARRTAAARLGLRLAQERITERLRYALGISYVAWLDWYLLGRGFSEAVVSAGVLGGYEQMAAEEIVESFEELAADGPSATDLRWLKREAAFRTTARESCGRGWTSSRPTTYSRRRRGPRPRG